MTTPMMKQYLDIKARYPTEILLFRMGDFYETFYDDAKKISKILNITLTSRSKSKSGERIPLAGFPWHALDGYLARLVKAGCRIAICEQTEDPKTAIGIVKRDVIEVITPGTLVSGSALSERSSVLLCSAYSDGNTSGLVLCDISTGEITATALESKVLAVEIARMSPSELLVPEGTKMMPPQGCEITELERWKYDIDTAVQKIKEVLQLASLEGLGINKSHEATIALGALLYYLSDMKRSVLSHLSFRGMYFREDCLIIDKGSARALGLVEARSGEESAVLADITDRTMTPAGAREWRKRLSAPPRDPEVITSRYDAIDSLISIPSSMDDIRGILDNTADLQRQAGKLGTLRSAPRDLRAIADTLALLPELTENLNGLNGDILQTAGKMDTLAPLREYIDSMIVDSPPLKLSDGGVIRDGVSEELDELWEIKQGGRKWIKSREKNEREVTGIPNLTIGYNKVFGYHISVSKSHLDKVPEHYIRKQTLVNAERFITPELKEVEAKVLRAGEEIEKLEASLYSDIREEIAKQCDRISETGRVLAELDVICSLAYLAKEMGYVRPELSLKSSLKIKAGKHPVLDQILPQGECVPNDLMLDLTRRILLVTGPNMAGKSTYLRQTALLVIMAQAGSFVPAESMIFSPVDRIFTRIGSSDRITRGQSTFLVEMAEAASLLNASTSSSLAILDEVGRGTSTYDGLSLAWAMVEYLQNNAQHNPMVLFATHYHELTELGKLLPAVENVNVRVEETGNRVVFLYDVEDGCADDSYGIHVASMAGVPKQVVRRAKKVLADLEAGKHLMHDVTDCNQLELMIAETESDDEHPILDNLRKIDPNELTPKQALEILYELRDKLD